MRFALPVIALVAVLLLVDSIQLTRPDSAAASQHILTFQEVGGSGIAGTATLTAVGSDVEVVVEVTGLVDADTYASGAYDSTSVNCAGGLLGSFSDTYPGTAGGVTFTVPDVSVSDIFSVSVRTGDLSSVLACAERVAPAEEEPAAEEADIFRQFAEAINQGDTAGALALFTDDATWERGGRCPPGACVGIVAVQGEIEKDIADHHQIDVISVEVTGNTVNARVELRTDGTRARGVERIIHLFTLEVAGDKIASLHAAPDLTDPVTADFAARGPGGLPATGTGGLAASDDRFPTGSVALISLGGLLVATGVLILRRRFYQP